MIKYFLKDIARLFGFYALCITFNLVILFVVSRDIFIGELNRLDFNGKVIENVDIDQLNFGGNISNILAIALAEFLIKPQGLSGLFEDNDYNRPVLSIFDILLGIIKIGLIYIFVIFLKTCEELFSENKRKPIFTILLIFLCFFILIIN